MHPRTARSLGALVLLATASTGARAQEVEAPRLIEDPGVSYPAALLAARVYERAEVPLILELDDTGRVLDASLELPGSARTEFEAAALEAARGLRFLPARRDGAALGARIRFVYGFEPGPAVLRLRVIDAESR